MTPQTQRQLRSIHNMLGVFFAPGLLFFGFTGLLQTIGLHERHDGNAPPAWIAAIANLHKHQVVTMKPRGPRPAAAPVARPAGGGGEHDDHDAPFSLLKIYVLLLSVMLIGSTLSGVTIALTNRAARRRTWVLLTAGLVVPVLLMLV